MIRRTLIEGLALFRVLRSALLPPSCRFWPTCSRYAEDALTHHGVLHASGLILMRLLRCHPFHPGGYDPVPSRISHG